MASAPSWWLRPGDRGQLLLGAIAAGIVVVLLVSYAVVVSINNARYPPGKPVNELFAALTARDGASAARLGNCTSPSCGEILSAGYDPPTDVRITGVVYGGPGSGRTDNSVATVQVAYRLAGGEQTAVILVQRSGNLLSRPFHIVSGATARLAITATHVDKVHLGGVVVPVTTDTALTATDTERAVTVLPGTYTVRVTDDDPLFANPAGPLRVDVAASADELVHPLEVTVPVQVRADVVAEVEERVRALLTGCAEQQVLDPPGCPFQVSDIVIGADDVRWTVLRLPVVEVVAVQEPKPGDGQAVVRTVTPGWWR